MHVRKPPEAVGTGEPSPPPHQAGFVPSLSSMGQALQLSQCRLQPLEPKRLRRHGGPEVPVRGLGDGEEASAESGPPRVGVAVAVVG
jgi:hypothetical protein